MGKRRQYQRSIGDYSRKTGNKQREAILIVCEGLTEKLYFEGLRDKLKLSLVEVEIEESDSSPISVVDHALKSHQKRKRELKKAKKRGESLFEKPSFEKVWCVFDKEGVQADKTSFYRAVDKIKGNKILAQAISTPAIEFWFLLHFQNTTRPFTNADEVITLLKQFIPEYDKKQDVLPVIFEKLYHQTDDARRRAEQVLKSCLDDEQFPNPSTWVHKLVAHLEAMG